MTKYFINLSEEDVSSMNDKLWIWDKEHSIEGELEVEKPHDNDILSIDESDGGILEKYKKIVYVKKENK